MKASVDEAFGAFELVAQVSLSGQTRIIGAVLALLFFGVLVELVRRHKLQERYTIAWFLAAAFLLVLVIVPDVLLWLAQAMGIADTTVALFALILFAFLGLLLHLTVVISRLNEQTTRLAQELAVERAARQADAFEEPVPVAGDSWPRADGDAD